MCETVLSFFTSGRLLKEVNHTFLTLIPMVTNSSHLADYRPISYCNVLHKIISKILSNRLQVVVTDLISSNQMCILERKTYQ